MGPGTKDRGRVLCAILSAQPLRGSAGIPSARPPGHLEGSQWEGRLGAPRNLSSHLLAEDMGDGPEQQGFLGCTPGLPAATAS